MKKPEARLPTIMGLFMAVGGLVAGLWMIKNQVNLSTKAAADETPRQVNISNITDTAFTVSWITDKASLGFIQYGNAKETADLVVSDDRDLIKGSVSPYLTHYINIKGLKPETEYNFKIGSGKKLFDQEGQFYKVITGKQLTNSPAAGVAYGQVISENGDPADGAIVYLQIEGATRLSALVKQSGAFVIPVSTGRTEDGGDWINYDRKLAKFLFTIEDGISGETMVETTASEASPVTTIVTGKSLLPTATPTTEAIVIVTQSPSPTPTPEVMTVQVQKEKDTILGTAPANSQITVEIHSAVAITQNITTDSNGNYDIPIPPGLEPGEHTITVTAIVNGVAKKITKTFIVEAATLPEFTASPSATVKPTALPTKTPTPTKKPTATPKPTKVVAEITATPTPTYPVSGSSDWTFGVLLAGVILIVGGYMWYQKA